MEENTTAMQALVIAHAAYGHNSFFIRPTTCSSCDRCVEHHRLPRLLEELHRRVRGASWHANRSSSCRQLPSLQNYGVDRYRRPSKLSFAEETARRKERLEHAHRRSMTSGARCPKSRQGHEAPRQALPRSCRRTSCTSSRSNRRLLEPWQREVVLSCARSRSTSTRSARRR